MLTIHDPNDSTDEIDSKKLVNSKVSIGWHLRLFLDIAKYSYTINTCITFAFCSQDQKQLI